MRIGNAVITFGEVPGFAFTPSLVLVDMDVMYELSFTFLFFSVAIGWKK